MENVEVGLEESRCLRIRFMNGNERVFAFSPLEGQVDATTLYTRLHKMLDSRRLLLQLEDRMVLIPFDNIETIEILPAPGMVVPEALHVVHEFG
jgi:hypothetical protein